mgnify:CR=1 FL=1
MLRRVAIIVTVALLLGVLSGPAAALAAPAVTLTTDTPAVEVGLRYAGTTVRFAGKCPPGSDVYVRVLGPVGKTSLSKRGQKGGVWLTVETVTVSNAPRFFWLLGSADPAALPAGLQQATGLAPGYRALYEQVKVTALSGEEPVRVPPREAEAYITGLIKINERRGLYGFAPQAIRVNGDSFMGTLHLPAGVPRGDLQMVAYAVKDGRLLGTASATLPVQGVGFVKWLGETAQHRAVQYGAMAIVVALAAGLTVAELFRRINACLGGKGEGELTGGH